ncbi:MAG: ADP-ribosylglycohydrolase family protein [Firmicutes bacterium]|nr:ADP-ribosylglycohydrolase family protein [Bacillota bacterium]
MLGAIFGDIVGSVYETDPDLDYNFPLLKPESRPTDDSIMTIAVAKALMETYGKSDDEIRNAVVKNMQKFGRMYMDAGYGRLFMEWLKAEDPKPYNSFGNGSGMRVSPVGWMYDSLEETLRIAKLTAEVTHNHPEGIKGAQAVAAAVFMARTGCDKEEIRKYIEETFDYDLSRTLAQIKPTYKFHETCQKSVPESIISFYEAECFEDAVRNAVYLRGDTDTMACMAGAIAEAYFGMPEEFRDEAVLRLDEPLKEVVFEFLDFLKKNK